MTVNDFRSQAALQINKSFYGGIPAATLTTTVAAIATTLSSETKTHDLLIEKYIAPTLHPGKTPDRWQDILAKTINRGFAGNLTAAQMSTTLTTLSAGPFPVH